MGLCLFSEGVYIVSHHDELHNVNNYLILFVVGLASTIICVRLFR